MLVVGVVIMIMFGGFIALGWGVIEGYSAYVALGTISGALMQFLITLGTGVLLLLGAILATLLVALIINTIINFIAPDFDADADL